MKKLTLALAAIALYLAPAISFAGPVELPKKSTEERQPEGGEEDEVVHNGTGGNKVVKDKDGTKAAKAKASKAAPTKVKPATK